MQNLMAYHCSCKHSLLFMAEYTREVVQTHFILTTVTQSHVNLILCNLHKIWTIHSCYHISVDAVHCAECPHLYQSALVETFFFFLFFSYRSPWQLNSPGHSLQPAYGVNLATFAQFVKISSFCPAFLDLLIVLPQNPWPTLIIEIIDSRVCGGDGRFK